MVNQVPAELVLHPVLTRLITKPVMMALVAAVCRPTLHKELKDPTPEVLHRQEVCNDTGACNNYA